MNYHVITLFPEMIMSYLAQGVIGKAYADGKFNLETINLREYGQGSYRQVDDRVYGGGAGMVLMFEPMAAAISAIKERIAATNPQAKIAVLATSAKGVSYTQETAKQFLNDFDDLIILCGRYEGFDQRIIEELVDIEVSLGHFVLSGGELAALCIIDSVSRMMPGVLSKEESFQHDSHFNEVGEIQFPQYTRPEVVSVNGKDLKVPEILLSGDHAKIADWRKQQTVSPTKDVENNADSK